MSSIEIVRHTPDELVRYVWTFHFFDDRLFLCLDAYTTEIRQSKRHKFKRSTDVLHYSRINISGRNWLKEEDVPFPKDVAEEALNGLRRKIRVGLWKDGKGLHG